MTSPLRYSELLPKQLSQEWTEGRPAIFPLGALEWHGDHLPLGLDLIVAEWFAEELALQVGGVLLPSSWAAITTLPHPFSLQSPSSAQPMVWESILTGLAKSGCQRMLVISGHYAQGHLIELFNTCLKIQKENADITCLAGTPLQMLSNPDLLDHAGRSEASQLLAIRPDLVALDKLNDPSNPADSAVLGPSPAESSAEEGRELLNQGLQAWEAAANWNPEQAAHWMKQELAGLESYRQTWLSTTWEDAISRWWEARSNQA